MKEEWCGFSSKHVAGIVTKSRLVFKNFSKTTGSASRNIFFFFSFYFTPLSLLRLNKLKRTGEKKKDSGAFANLIFFLYCHFFFLFYFLELEPKERKKRKHKRGRRTERQMKWMNEFSVGFIANSSNVSMYRTVFLSFSRFLIHSFCFVWVTLDR